jgi:sugar-specific transcriptional regulator TrmB
MNNEQVTKHLEKLGLGDKAALIYSTLLEMGGAYPSALADATRLNRSTVYKILVDLSVKGLVTEVERGKKLYFQIEKPEKLIRYTKDQADMARETYDKAREFMPEFEKLFASNSYRPVIRYFEDADGIASIYEDMAAEKKYEMLAFSHGEAFKDYLPQRSLQKFVKAKEQNGITTRAIAPDTEANRKYNPTVFKGIKKAFWPDIRFVPKEIFPFEAEMTLYGDSKLAITKLRGKRLVGIVIDDKLIHDMFKMIFELTWKSDQVKRVQ